MNVIRSIVAIKNVIRQLKIETLVVKGFPSYSHWKECSGKAWILPSPCPHLQFVNRLVFGKRGCGMYSAAEWIEITKDCS